MNPTPMNVRQAAYTATANALRRGEIIKPKRCDECRKRKPLVAHHPDYSQPKKVAWLCGSCHKRAHIDAGEVKHWRTGAVVALKAKTNGRG